MYVRKEAVLSSQIEGTQSLLQDLLAAEAQLYTPETPKDVEEVVVSVNEVRDVTGTSYPAANQLIERLVRIGILTEITGRSRNRRFRYDAYVELFDEHSADNGGPAR
jgi:Fic family protein